MGYSREEEQCGQHNTQELPGVVPLLYKRHRNENSVSPENGRDTLGQVPVPGVRPVHLTSSHVELEEVLEDEGEFSVHVGV